MKKIKKSIAIFNWTCYNRNMLQGKRFFTVPGIGRKSVSEHPSLPELQGTEDAAGLKRAAKMWRWASGENPPAPKNVSPARKNRSPACKNHSPARKNDSPARKNHCPAAKNDSPAQENRSPAGKSLSPAAKNVSPARKNRPPARKNHCPAYGNRKLTVKNYESVV
jgi:hypothetical protein